MFPPDDSKQGLLFSLQHLLGVLPKVGRPKLGCLGAFPCVMCCSVWAGVRVFHRG